MLRRSSHQSPDRNPGPWHYAGPNTTFGSFLRQERMKRSMSRAMLAAKSGLLLPHITALEGNQALPTVDDIRRLSNVLGVSSKDLITLAGYAPAVEQQT